MKKRLNKPRVFLSHSKKDAELIRQLHTDLNRCQIETWIDEIDIRPGQPWLDAIFEEGIPTCDCIFIYLTEHSVNSTMVKKELDAAVLGQLEDNNIALLPYVSSGTVRASLRADIRSLQAPVLNEENYSLILSQLVAEIWRSFMERTVAGAVQHERVKRLEAELELEKIRNASGDGIFTDSEEQEFAYIAKQLDREEVVKFTEEEKTRERRELRVICFSVKLLTLLPKITDSASHLYSQYIVEKVLHELLENSIPPDERNKIERKSVLITSCSSFTDEFLRYGFVRRVVREKSSYEVGGVFMPSRPSYHFDYTDRLERFKYWLTVKEMMPEEVEWKLINIEKFDDAAE